MATEFKVGDKVTYFGFEQNTALHRHDNGLPLGGSGLSIQQGRPSGMDTYLPSIGVTGQIVGFSERRGWDQEYPNFFTYVSIEYSGMIVAGMYGGLRKVES